MAEFNRLHDRYHAWQPSALTDLNDHIARGEPYPGDAEMVYLLKAAIALAERSDTTFNPALGHLIRQWGLQNDNAADKQPAPHETHHWVDAHTRKGNKNGQGTWRER